MTPDAPSTVHPSLWRHALLNNHRGRFKVTDGVYQVRGEPLANVTFAAFDNRAVLDRLFGLLNEFPSWFPIASHDLKPGEPEELR